MKARALLVSALALTVGALLGAGAFLVVAGRRQSPPRFDAVSIKPDQPTGPFAIYIRSDPRMLEMGHYTLAQLVQYAWNLKDYQFVVTAPAWVSDERFDVDARSAAPSSAAEKQQMLQVALTEQFGIELSHAKKMRPAYLLKPAGHGIRLKPATDTAHCGEVTIRPQYIRASCLSMDDIADVLAEMIFKDRPVLNQTGTGSEARYQLDLEFPPPEGPERRFAPDAQDLFSVLPDQAGLRLVAGRARLEMWVLRGATRPAR